MSDFTEALENFRAASEEVLIAHFARNEFTFAVPGIEIGKGGKRFRKLWRTETFTGHETRRNSIHAFVEIETGLIFKPASTKAPAKHARGNVYENAGRDCLTDAGHVHYLR